MNVKSGLEEETGSVLLLQVPRTNEKKELAAEQMLASLHGLLHGGTKGFFKTNVRDRVSFEIAVKAKRIGFYVWVPEHLKSFVEEQIYAQYPNVHITEVEDYAFAPSESPITMSAELKFSAPQQLPIKTFPSFEVDPLAAITATLAQFEEHEEAWIQAIIRPADDSWHKASEKYIASIRDGSGPGIIKMLMGPGDGKTAPSAPRLAEHQTARISGAETKSQKLAYDVCIRIVYRGHTTAGSATMRLQSIIASYKQFNTTYLNGFSQKFIDDDPVHLRAYQARRLGKGFLCNIEEVASLYHLPHTNVETPNILWANAKTAEPPASLPVISEANSEAVSPIAVTNFRGHNTMFGINRVDRGRHLYIIGQTGVGKSGLLELLTISDIYSPYGFAVVDPHGDYAINILKRIPEERAKDVIYFNPADTDFPIAFNPMEVIDAKLKSHTASELIGVLKRMFESWGPRLEYILRYSILALLDYPNATMLDITRILTDKKFRYEVLEHVNDPVVKNFWFVEFASWNDKFAAEAVAPVLNKVGAFTANPVVRNIIGQPKSSFNVRKIMDERKILIVNLSRGLIGEDNAGLLGALLVTKIQLGAMSRADIPPEERSPFYLYVDEFQNFATDSFATILSEARKYGLNLTVANQYISQMSQEVRDAVFGNVGSIISFRTSADDARVMLKYFEPAFLDGDLVHMHNRDFVVSMTIDGDKVQAFSATTLPLPEYGQDYSAEIVAESRAKYAVVRGHIETFMQERYGSDSKPQNRPRQVQTTNIKPVIPSVEKQSAQKENVVHVPGPIVDHNKVAKDIINLATPSNQSKASDNDDNLKTRPKRKRSRSRRRKSGLERTAPTQPRGLSPENGETVIRLR